jgi:putative two-component system response regulator
LLYSDFFDAVRTERPYRKAFEVQAIVKLMKEAVGKDFNPMLFDNFLKALKKIGAV